MLCVDMGRKIPLTILTMEEMKTDWWAVDIVLATYQVAWDAWTHSTSWLHSKDAWLGVYQIAVIV